MIGLEKGDEDQHPGHVLSRQYKQLNTRWGIIFLDDRIIIPSGMRDTVLKCIALRSPGGNKMLATTQKYFGGQEWPKISKTRQRECIACRNAGKNLKTQIPLNR